MKKMYAIVLMAFLLGITATAQKKKKKCERNRSNIFEW